MQPFTRLSAVAAPLRQANVDTDVIIRIERLTAPDQGTLGDYALESLRYLPDGSENPHFVLNKPRYRQAQILIAGANFGCGSSREGAVVALQAWGFRSIIAPSFGDIFYGNCFQNGVLPVRLDGAAVDALFDETEADGGVGPTTVDLVAQQVTAPSGRVLPFTVDPQQRTMLLTGLDEVGQTMRLDDEIRAWQANDRVTRPWVWGR